MSVSVSSKVPELGTLLVVLLAVVYPYHVYIRYSLFEVNVSSGDFVVFFIVLLFLLGVFGHRKVPGVFVYIVAFCLVSTVLLVYQWVWPLGGRDYLSLSAGILGVIKFASGTMWLLAVYAVAVADYRRLLWQFGVASIVTADLVVGYVLAIRWIQDLGRAGFVFQDPNLFANYIALNAFISAALLRSVNSGNLTEYLLKLSIPVFLTGIAVTSSRSAVIGLVAGITFAILLRWDTRGYDVSSKTAAQVGVVGAGALAYTVFGSTLVSRFVDILRLGDSVSERLRLYRVAAELFYKHPLVGVGFRQFRFYTKFEIADVHNTYFQIGAELGLVGLILFLLLCAHLVRRSVLIADNEHFGTEWLGGFLFMTIVQGLFLNVENFRSLWLTAGFILVIYHCERSRNADSPTV